MTELDLRQKVVQQIAKWKGAKQGSATHREIIGIYNSQPKLPRGVRMATDYAWCAATASAAYLAAGVADYTGTECSCACWIELAIRRGIWIERDDYLPKIGDAVFYNWKDGQDFAKTDNRGAPNHVGIVTRVGNGTFTVTEGNKGTPSQVGDREMKVNGRYIRGFLAPDYTKAARDLSGSAADMAIGKLAQLGVINSPDYWRQTVADGSIQYLDELFVKAARRITTAGLSLPAAVKGVSALTTAGVINSPDYWLKKAESHPNLAKLLKALGGAVRAS